MSDTTKKVFIQKDRVQRAKAGRVKNWKCCFPGCDQPPKTRFNCYAHTWDTHLRYARSAGSSELPQCFKDIPNKEEVKKLCDPYMVKLVTSPYPFDFESKIDDLKNDRETIINNTSIKKETIPDERVSPNTSTVPPQTEAIVPADNIIQMPLQSAPIDQKFLEIVQMGQAVKQLHVLGEVFAENGFLTRSDERAKEKIQSINNSLDTIMKLRGVKYRYRGMDKIKFGFIAQELRDVIPDLVREDEKGLFIDTEGILPFLVESLKELSKTVIEYKAQNEELGELQRRVDDAFRHLDEIRENERVDANGLKKKSQDCGGRNDEEFGEGNSEEKEKDAKKVRVIDTVWGKVKTLLGPPPFVLFAFLFSVFFLVIVPSIFTRFYFIIVFFIVLSAAALFGVVFNRKEIVKFLKEGKSFFPSFLGWELYQIVTWYIIFSIFMCLVMLTLVIGSYVCILVGLYAFAAFLSLALVFFIWNNTQKCLPKQVLVIPLVILQALAITSLVLSVIYQPFNENMPFHNSLSNYNIIISENVKVDQSMIPISWNCFKPKFRTEPELPKGLGIEIEETEIPYIRGVIETVDYEKYSNSSNNVTVDLVCSGYLVLKYPNVTIHNCGIKLKSDKCATPECSFCVMETQDNSWCSPCDKLQNFMCRKNGGTPSCSL
ncbi:hypothetical protein EIN_281750 [Entamoeba invadens IP1]|uniref:Peptidase S74 domain-containing protein n=1 Tax=Entamoeba invadens IP1 TaxID=370355 RepID=A0A0A1U2N4_ENTIV|nr:hypothetical protein EIN_281750 [Entamoeba invadens IP1]ELP85804.1 hypothetical protein EIN_281750 [Entamoeba invadens IP1]|eukprot:XP_004185150.1 hypothetical protein EIN_281750 [Entamoeba invadens IP1]